MSPEQVELYNAINKILWEDWNPIGAGMPRDEYDSYVPQVFKLVLEGAPASKIAEHLHGSTVRMGLTSSTSNYLSIAEKIQKLKSPNR
ncbi:MAG: hypothetical protein HY282_16355 [Nitrospirae bacterium]|nr:hypothetical protein [Candidatus Manganitrophaceae bacterium]